MKWIAMTLAVLSLGYGSESTIDKRDLNGFKWPRTTPRTTVTYSLTKTTKTVLNKTINPIPEANIKAVTEGVESWGLVCGITLKQVEDNGQIQVGTSQLASLLCGYATYSGKTAVVQIADWIGPTGSKKITIHEIGHTIGLGHTEEPTAIMFSNAAYTPQTETFDDFYYAQKLYGESQATIESKSTDNRVILQITKASVKQITNGKDTGVKVVSYELIRTNPDGSTTNIQLPTDYPNADPSRDDNQITYREVPPISGNYQYQINTKYADGSSITSRTINVALTNVNNSLPEFLSIPQQTLIGNKKFNLNVVVADQDNDPVTVTCDMGDGTVINDTSISHTYPTYGFYTVTITASDGVSTNSMTIPISVYAKLVVSKITANIRGPNNDIMTIKGNCGMVKPGDVISFNIREQSYTVKLDGRLTGKIGRTSIKFYKNQFLIKTSKNTIGTGSYKLLMTINGQPWLSPELVIEMKMK